MTLQTHSLRVMDAAGRFTILLTVSSLVGGSPSHSVQRCPAMALAISDTQRLTAETPAASTTVRGYAIEGNDMVEKDVPTILRSGIAGTVTCLF